MKNCETILHSIAARTYKCKNKPVCVLLNKKDPLTAVTVVPLLFCRAFLLTTDYDHGHGQEQQAHPETHPSS